jgi:hypothetical protein
MKAKTRVILAEAIDNGLIAGWHLAHKHTPDPDDETMSEAMHHAIWLCIDEVFTFEDDL